ATGAAPARCATCHALRRRQAQARFARRLRRGLTAPRARGVWHLGQQGRALLAIQRAGGDFGLRSAHEDLPCWFQHLKEVPVRVTTLLRRLLGVSHTVVRSVRFDDDAELVVEVAPTWRKPRCGLCCQRAPGTTGHAAPGAGEKSRSAASWSG